MKIADVCIIEKIQKIFKGLPYVGLEDIESNTGRFIGSKLPQDVKSSTFSFSTEHLLYGRLRPYLNKVYAPDFNGHCSTEIMPLKPKPNITRSFLQYWLMSYSTVAKISSTSTGARMPRANVNSLLGFEIFVPPMSEQQRIVKILDEAFEGIAIAKANAEKNLKNAHNLFESYLHLIFTRQSNDWNDGTLGEYYDVRDGTHDSPKYHKTGYPLITSKNLKTNGLSFDDVSLISEEDFLQINKRSAVDRGDVLFAMIGTIGNPTLVAVEPNFAIKNVALFKIPSSQSSEFLQYYLSSSAVITKMMNDARGSTQKFVGLGYLRNFPIHLPPLQKQQEIVHELNMLKDEITLLESVIKRKIIELEALKKSILNEAFTGNL